MPTDALQQLEDTDRGIFQVTTEASIYLLDLDRRRLLRAPGAGTGAGIGDDGSSVRIGNLPDDHHWIPLVQLVQCRLHKPLLAYAEHPDGIRLRISTLIEQIRPLPVQDAAATSGTDASHPAATPSRADPDPPEASPDPTSDPSKHEER